MRKLTLKLMLALVFVAGIAGAALVPAHADGGSPFGPNDNRINPLTGDRLAVYCNSDNVQVLGVDNNSAGFYLTTFNLSELMSSKAAVHSTANGTVSLKMDSPAQTHWGYATDQSTALSLITDVGTQYHITWTGGAYGADGSSSFVKTFSCTYLPQ